MLHLPILRWGQPYDSLEKDEVVHFSTGEPMATVSRANGGLIQRDMRKAQRARDVLREIPIDDLIARAGKAGELYINATLPMGDGTQSPDEFARAQSASTGLPEKMCRANMKKNGFVLAEMRKILDSLTRGLALDVLSNGHGDERGVPISFQVGVPREAISLYPGGGDVGAAVLDALDRTMIFGGQQTVDRYRGNPKVQAHGPGFSKIVIGDDVVDRWEEFLDMMVDSVFLNSGRGCINCSGIWASRHTEEIADAIAQRLAKIEPLPPDHPDASLAAFTVPGVADAI